MTLLTAARRRGHVLAALASSVVATIAVALPTTAQVTPAAGSGSLVASLGYANPGIPGNLTTCGLTTWSLTSTSAPTPVINVPTAGGFVDLHGDAYAGGLSFSGSEAQSCEAGWGGNGSINNLNVTDNGALFQGDTMSCALGNLGAGALKGGVWVRTGVLMTLVGWGDCTVHGVFDGTTFFAIEGTWAPTSTPNMSSNITSAELTASWVAA